jgi:hypothetical protein
MNYGNNAKNAVNGFTGNKVSNILRIGDVGSALSDLKSIVAIWVKGVPFGYLKLSETLPQTPQTHLLKPAPSPVGLALKNGRMIMFTLPHKNAKSRQYLIAGFTMGAKFYSLFYFEHKILATCFAISR